MVNLAATIAKLVTGQAVEAPLTATAANIMAAVLLRQEDMINFSFELVSRLPFILPFPIRRTIGHFHHYGIPWLRIRRVPITASRLSTRELHLTFPFTHMLYTSTLRFSTRPLLEWHAFATIPLSATHASILIFAAGDWTTSILAHPPKTLWIRNPPAQNFLKLVPLFKDVLIVATGAGIAPVLSFLASPSVRHLKSQNRKVRVLWCVSEPGAAHWGFVLAALRGVDEQAVVFDSRVKRPDVASEARGLCEREGLEAVFVVSNARVTGEGGCGVWGGV
ncbi:hypothetical protein E8E11_008475 [Didymella keratinophila]|nr:hypothetical protein E8E11_008475 [Didymella keratinophila]